MVASRSIDDHRKWSVDDRTSRSTLTGGRCRRSARRRTLSDVILSTPLRSTADHPPSFDSTPTTTPTLTTPTEFVVSGTDLTDQLNSIRTAPPVAPGLLDLRNLSLASKCDGCSDPFRHYENIPNPTSTITTLDSWDSWAADVTSLSSAPASQVPQTARLLMLPGDGAGRKVCSSSSSSTSSSACDSAVLELCCNAAASSSTCCSSSSCCCSEITHAATPVADAAPLSLPDSGNGSGSCCEAGFRFSARFATPEPPPPPPSGNSWSVERLHHPGTVVGTAASYCQVASFLPEWDAERLETVYSRLTQSGFYYGRLGLDAADQRLRHASVGTFLVRDSTDDRHLFSVSVQTCRGTTSIRLIYGAGLFRLDCSPEQEHLMPTFDCALRLLVHYVRLCTEPPPPRRRLAGSSSCHVTTTGSSYVFVESGGRRDTPVVLRRPLYRRVDRLVHLCRRAIHRALGRGPKRSDADRASTVDRLQLIPSLKAYLKDYPYEL